MNGVLLLRASSPITHGADTQGNEQIIRREAVMTPFGVKYVPVLTGNSLRHRLFREPIANELSGEGGLSKESLRWLYNGGALAGKHPNVDVRRMILVRELVPHIESLGCSLPDTIVSGKLSMGIAWMACWETERVLSASLPNGWIDDVRLLPSHEYLSRNQYYRHDIASRRAEFLSDNDRDGKDYAGMPHGGEHVMPGAMFVCAFSAPGLSELGQSALIHALELWCESGATVGGQSSRGHGVVEPFLWLDSDVTSEMHKEHLSAKKEEIRDFVDSLYAKGK